MATGPRAYEGNRLIQAGAVRYEHDTQGRIVLRRKTRLSRKPDTWRYEWDPEDRLRTVTTPDGTVWRYTYDPLGRRISKQSALETVHFTWDGATLCEQTTDTVVLTWDHAGLRPLSQTERRTDTDDDRFFAIVTDLVGTPTELVDESGELAWHTRATLWGTTTWNTSATAYTPLRFPGQYFDPESGLHYNYFRYYDPESAHYLTQDPLGLAPAPNPSTYVDNPHTWSDPLGLTPCPHVDERKLDYLFDKEIKKDEHNTPRANQNAQQLRSIGFHDTPASRQYVLDHLREATTNGFSRTFSNQWGNFGEVHSVIYGPHGIRQVEATWQVMPDGGLRFSTAIFKGGK